MVVISDLHLGKSQDTIDIDGIPSRLYDVRQRCYEAIMYANKHGQSLVMAGDIFDTATPSPFIISIFFQILKYAAKLKVQVYIIPGNHDCGVKYHSMEFTSFINNEEFGSFSNTMIITSPCVIKVDGMKTMFLPHVPKSVIDTQAYLEYVVDYINEKDSRALDIVIGHAHIKGAVNSSDIELEAGDAINFNPSKFFKYKLGIFGHIHKHQILGKNIYCGPVVTNSFDEADIEKGFIHVVSSDDYKFVTYATDETKYKTINIDLINKDSIVYDEKRMAKLAKGKLLKLVVHARDMMQIDQADIKRHFEEYGTVVRFEIVLNDRYTGESDDDDIDEVFSAVNYNPVFKQWINDKSDLTKEQTALVLQLGYDIIAEVTNAERA